MHGTTKIIFILSDTIGHGGFRSVDAAAAGEEASARRSGDVAGRRGRRPHPRARPGGGCRPPPRRLPGVARRAHLRPLRPRAPRSQGRRRRRRPAGDRLLRAGGRGLRRRHRLLHLQASVVGRIWVGGGARARHCGQPSRRRPRRPHQAVPRADAPVPGRLVGVLRLQPVHRRARRPAAVRAGSQA